MIATEPRITAAEEVTLAAFDLANSAHFEFSEWELTIAAWRRNPKRFGLRGFEESHPDHKRVMMEIMGQKKKENPIRRRFLEKTRPNYYRITDLGRAEADLIRNRHYESTARSPGPIFDAVETFVKSSPFRAWLQNPEEPKSWIGATAFLGLTKYSANELNDRLRAMETSVCMALEWCAASKKNGIVRSPHGGSCTLLVSEMKRIPEFVVVLKNRFARQIAAILAKG